LSDRANDSSGGQSSEATGLPPGLCIDPSTGVNSGVVCFGEGGQDLPRPTAIISGGAPLPPPDPAARTAPAPCAAWPGTAAPA
jgi:hypothetical protein